MGMGALGGLAGGAGGMLPPDVAKILNDISPYISLGKGIYGVSKGNAGSGVGAAMTLGKLLQGAGS
jgi:hypothetical protein